MSSPKKPETAKSEYATGKSSHQQLEKLSTTVQQLVQNIKNQKIKSHIEDIHKRIEIVNDAMQTNNPSQVAKAIETLNTLNNKVKEFQSKVTDLIASLSTAETQPVKQFFQNLTNYFTELQDVIKKEGTTYGSNVQSDLTKATKPLIETTKETTSKLESVKQGSPSHGQDQRQGQGSQKNQGQSAKSGGQKPYGKM